MSAIWGIISKTKDVKTMGIKMDELMSKYAIDRKDSVFDDIAYFSCGHQYVTAEAHNDVSPVKNETSGITFVGDVFLTNRETVIEQLCENGNREEYLKMGDAYLTYLLFEKTGNRFIDYIRGSFAIVIYDAEKCEAKLYADHFSRRYLAYYVSDDMFCFGSVYGPIKLCIGDGLQLNEECITQFYMDFLPTSFRSPDITVYENICHVGPAECIIINLNTGARKKETYYRVGAKTKKLRLKDDGEYREAFLRTYCESVNSLLRCDEGYETAIQLSGGLDSSSIAALAAEQLDKNNKKLYGFTIIPASDYEFYNTREVIENEQPLVEAQAILHPNIVPNYISGDDGCAFTRLDKYPKMFEVPVKPAMNIDNICRVYEAAKNLNCKMILAGANGNASVSYGSTFYYVTEKLLKLQFGKAYKEIKARCRLMNCSRKKYIRAYLKGIIRSIFTNTASDLSLMLKDELIQKYGIMDMARKRAKSRGSEFYQTKKQRFEYVYNRNLFVHMGLYETYLSMEYGVLAIDPTLTVEMVEFCLSLPIDTQVKNGRERRTIRDYMGDCLPLCVTSENFGRGVQAADAEFRVSRDWEDIKENVYEGLTSPQLLEYFDKNKIDELISKVREQDGKLDRLTFIQALGVCSLSHFLKQ